jgi:hypothetical protein
MGALVIEPHGDIAKAWEKAIKEGNTDFLLQQISEMPVSEEEALNLVAQGSWGDAEFRNRTIGEWASLARGRYETGSKGMVLARNLPLIAALALGITMVVYMRRRSRT